MNPLTTSTSTSAYTGPGVQPAEDANVRNRILFSVVGGTVGLSVIIGVTFLLIRRKHVRRRESNEFRGNEVVPAIQPYLTHVRCESSRIDGHKIEQPISNQNDPSQDILLPISEVSADGFHDVSTIRFREQQLMFKEKRDRQRRISLRAASGPESPRRGLSTGASASSISSTLYPEPTCKEEQEVLEILYPYIDKNLKEKQLAYKELLLRWHPDKHPGNKEIATQVFQFLQARKEWFFGDTVIILNSP